MKKLGLTVGLLFATSALAVLAPFHESARVVTSILETPAVFNSLSPGAITSIVELPTQDGYKVTTNLCSLDVYVNYITPEQTFEGPLDFDLRVGEVNCGPNVGSLPQFAEDSRVLTAIFTKAEVSEALRMGPVISIDRLVDGYGFKLSTGQCTLDVNVAYISLEQPILGPQPFDLRLSQADCQ